MKRALAPADQVVVIYYVLIAVLTLVSAGHVRWAGAHLGWCAVVIATTVALARLAGRGSAGWAAVRDWFPLIALLTAFQQLAWLIPDVHPFSDGRFDGVLERLDERWFGDVRGFFRRFTVPALNDALSLCYWSYYLMPFLLAARLWWKRESDRFRETTAVLMTAWFLSYLGYIAVPGVGPVHSVDGLRDAALNEGLVAGPLHRGLMAVEGVIADAFPSGHALIAVTTLVLAWRHHRRLFWGILPPATGLVIATMYLRYHYVVDVLGGLALVPVSVALGRWLCRASDGKAPAT